MKTRAALPALVTSVTFGLMTSVSFASAPNDVSAVPRPSARLGKYINCPDVSTLKVDYLKQLQAHELYGSLEVLEREKPEVAQVARYYQNLPQKSFTHKFTSLTPAKLFDGGRIFTPGEEESLPKPGDVLLNMGFLNPSKAGNFYSKRGMLHARLVVAVDKAAKKFQTLDGGWQRFSTLDQVHHQTVWLRPKPEFFKAADQALLVAYANQLESVGYDSTLFDDNRQFRDQLNQSIDPLMASGALNYESQVLIRNRIINEIFQGRGVASYVPKSGYYCSEAPTDVFSFLGFRLYGEKVIDVMTAFSQKGDLPSWEAYKSALNGFSADQGPALVMHQGFYNYFTLVIAAHKAGVVKIGSLPADASPADLIKTNQRQAMQNPAGDLLLSQVDELARSQTPFAGPASAAAQGLRQLAAGLAQQWNAPGLNFTLAVQQLYFNTYTYGPQHFLENSKYFDLRGVYFNLNKRYQAKWVFDASDGVNLVNEQTTTYRIKPTTSRACEKSNDDALGSATK